MTTPSTMSAPYDWLKSVEPRLVGRRQIAIVQSPEGFSWEALTEGLAQHFEIAQLHLQPSTPVWLSAEEQKQQSLHAPTTALRYAIGDLPGEVQWIISTESATQLMTDLLTGEPGHLAVEDPAFLEGFLNYVAAEVVQQLIPLGFEQELTPKWLGSANEAPPSGKQLAIDVQVALANRSYATRLLVSDALASAWKQHFIRLNRRQSITPALAHQTEITAHLESGRVTLSQRQWSALSEGDFLLLDSSSLTPGVDKGRVMLTVAGVPLFRCMLKPGQIKLLEHPLYHEVETPMADNPHDHDEDDESFVEDETELTEDDDSAFDTEEFTEEADELDDEEAEEEEETTGDHEDEASEAHTEAEDHVEAEHEEPEHALTPADKIPLNIVIEVGRLQMTLSQLRDLQPGQLLDIDVKPEEGVDLVVNGACIGRGELLRVGETLGVRILELG